MPDDPLWADFEQLPKHRPVEQTVLGTIDISEWFTADRLNVEETPYTEIVCACDPKFGYAIGHELEEGYIDE